MHHLATSIVITASGDTRSDAARPGTHLRPGDIRELEHTFLHAEGVPVDFIEINGVKYDADDLWRMVRELAEPGVPVQPHRGLHEVATAIVTPGASRTPNPAPATPRSLRPGATGDGQASLPLPEGEHDDARR